MKRLKSEEVYAKEEHLYVVSYDITSNSLRNKVAKLLEGFGRRVQFSVFECHLTEERYKELYRKLFALTSKMPDGSVQFYPICDNCAKKKRVIGIAEPPPEQSEDPFIIV